MTKDLNYHYTRYLKTTQGIHLNANEKLHIENFISFILDEENFLNEYNRKQEEIVQRERPNEEAPYKCEICNKEKEDHEMRMITDVDLISKQYVCQDCLNGIK